MYYIIFDSLLFFVSNYFELFCLIPIIFFSLGYNKLFFLSLFFLIFSFVAACCMSVIYMNIVFNDSNYVHPDTLQYHRYLIDSYLNQAKLEDHKDCHIFLEKINNKIGYYICDNKHYFHQDCIEKWIIRNKSCPICRQ